MDGGFPSGVMNGSTYYGEVCFSSLSVQAALSIPHLALLFIFLALIEGRFQAKKKKRGEERTVHHCLLEADCVH